MKTQLIIILLLTACGRNESIDEGSVERITVTSTKDTATEIVDTMVEINTILVDDLVHYPIIKKQKTDSKSLELYLEYLREEWTAVPSPFEAKYNGNSFGDYHHIEFEDENGIMYDFGDGNNIYGDCELFFEDDQLTDNPIFLNKTMIVYWEWKVSTFPCCEGEMDVMTAKVPSIVSLELKD